MEQDILEELYRRYHHKAFLYTLTLCGDESLAEDLVADAFVKACISLPKDSPSFPYWLFRVCKNLWLDHVKKHKPLLGEEYLSQGVEYATPETLFLENERYRALWQAIGTLAPVDRELVTLHYFAGLPLYEVARSLNRSYPAVRQRLRRLRQTLRERMEEQGYDF